MNILNILLIIVVKTSLIKNDKKAGHIVHAGFIRRFLENGRFKITDLGVKMNLEFTILKNLKRLTKLKKYWTF